MNVDLVLSFMTFLGVFGLVCAIGSYWVDKP